jgi:hypothetical protein
VFFLLPVFFTVGAVFLCKLAERAVVSRCLALISARPFVQVQAQCQCAIPSPVRERMLLLSSVILWPAGLINSAYFTEILQNLMDSVRFEFKKSLNYCS